MGRLKGWALRHHLNKSWFTVFWLWGLYKPLVDLFRADVPVWETIAGVLGALAFAASLVAAFAVACEGAAARWRWAPPVVSTALAFGFTLGWNSDWAAMLVFCPCVAALAVRAVPAQVKVAVGYVAVTWVTFVVTGTSFGDSWVVLLLQVLIGVGIPVGMDRERTKAELRELERSMSQLAVSEERLRFARDLHDLLGHSLSLVTLKAQLAGRLVASDPEACARQIAEIEQVSRQALAEVRESVSGYRRPTLAVEAARARAALADAGIEALIDARVTERSGELPEAREAALAWALREAVTNVIRHSRARWCRVDLSEPAGEYLLQVANDGAGDGASEGVPPRYGNGLTGLAERLALEGGRLETCLASGGFRVRGFVPAVERERVPAAAV